MARSLSKTIALVAPTLLLLAACPGSPSAVVPPGNPKPAPVDDTTTPPAETPSAPVPARLEYPESPRQDIGDDLHGDKVADPYRWLENAEDERVAAWMRAQGEMARDYLDRMPARPALAKRLAELNYYDAVSAPLHRKGRYFFSRRHADKEKAVIYWKQGDKGADKVLIDPNLLSDDGSISLGGWWPSPDGKKVAYKLKPNNADAATMYILDVDSGETSKQDVIEGAKYAGASWTPDGSGFYYTRLPVDPSIAVADLPGHAHVRFHRLGDDPARDELIHPATGDPTSFMSAELSKDGRYLILVVEHGWTATDVYFKDLSARPRRVKKNAPVWEQHGFAPLVRGLPAVFRVAVWRDRFYVITNYKAPRYQLFSVNPRRPAMARWRLIVPEDAAVLDSFRVVGEHLVLEYMRNAHSELEVRTLDGAPVRKIALPGLGSVAGVIGNEDEDEAYYSYTSFAEVPQIYRTSIAGGGSELWAKIDLPVDTSKMVVEQVWYPSRDGTKVSMFLIRNQDARPTGDNPVLLYGYGGFNISMTPRFRTNAVAWLEHGGIYAVANLRGGGEYGEDWHKAGMLLTKQTTFDDFIHAARYLIDAGWTSSERLAIAGGSNGGLLVGAAMTQEPSLFKAVACSVPLLDMVRYHLFGSGKTWISEYGSAADPEQFKVLRAYSPYHRVQKGVPYPALLMLSADSDDRVDPMHARKFVAAVQWAQSGDAPALLRIEKNAGHGGADMIRQRVEQEADRLSFLMYQLGMK